MASLDKEENTVSAKQCAAPKINKNYAKISRIGLRIAFTSIVFFGFGDLFLFSDFRSMFARNKFSDNVIGNRRNFGLFEGK